MCTILARVRGPHPCPHGRALEAHARGRRCIGGGMCSGAGVAVWIPTFAGVAKTERLRVANGAFGRGHHGLTPVDYARVFYRLR